MNDSPKDLNRDFARNGVVIVVLFVSSVLAGVVAVLNFVLHKPAIAWIWIAAAVLNTINAFFSLGRPFIRIRGGVLFFSPALLRGEQTGDLDHIHDLDVQKKKVVITFGDGQTMKIPLSGMNKSERPELIEILRRAAAEHGQGSR